MDLVIVRIPSLGNLSGLKLVFPFDSPCLIANAEWDQLPKGHSDSWQIDNF